MSERVLVAGIGNVFFGDDGFGVEVAQRLLDRVEPWPAGVRVGEYGIRGLHLAFDVLDGYDTLVLVDALPMGEAPGTVAVLEVDPSDVVVDGEPGLDAHSMSPAAVLSLLAGRGGSADRVLVVGCQPATIDGGIGLSDVVQEAVPAAVGTVEGLIAELVKEETWSADS